MTRVEFNKKIINLLARMFLEKEYPIIDFVKRSPEEQNRLFKLGKSNCDGINTHSAHEFGKAADIYFVDEDDLDADGITAELNNGKKGYEFWHKIWEEMGGKPLTDWYRTHDIDHFEG